MDSFLFLIGPNFWANVFHSKRVCLNFDKLCFGQHIGQFFSLTFWTAYWAIFSLTNPVTLLVELPGPIKKRFKARKNFSFISISMKQSRGQPQLVQRLLAGLPDGLFSNQKSQFGYILVGLGMENIVIFYENLNILRPFGIISGRLV
jgi:hypothetical protein